MIKLGADADPDPLAATGALSLEESEVGSLATYRR
jgi:hypothetical protein